MLHKGEVFFKVQKENHLHQIYSLKDVSESHM